MAANRVERKLAAILAVDVVGYSRLMAADERGTHARLKALRKEFIEPTIAEHYGRIVNLVGDGALVEFASAVDAVECAMAIQTGVAERQAEVRKDQRIAFRVGINIGDIITEEDDIYGDGVNVAARLEALAEPGGICVSRTVYNHIKNKVAFGFESMGEHTVKNIPEPVVVYRVLRHPGPVAKTIGLKRGAILTWHWAILIVAILISGGTAGLAVWLEPWANRERTDPGKPPAPAVAAADDPVLAMPSGPAIAVLPFENLSDDPKQEFFADGLTEDIITRLARFTNLRVIARNSTFRFKNEPVDVRQIHTELGTRYVVEGSVRRSADELRVTAQLVDAAEGAHLWAETYNRNLSASAVFEVQDDVTDRVVAAIASSQGAIALGRIQDIRQKPPEHLDSYECVLLAHLYERLNDQRSHLEALNCLERAVEREPDYAEAWAQLAYLYHEQIWSNFNVRADQDPAELAARAAQRAVELDPRSVRGRMILAFERYYRRDRDAFLIEAERSLALNPNDTSALAEMSLRFGIGLGMWERAFALAEKAIALAANPPSWYYGVWVNYHYQQGEYEEALEANHKFMTQGLYWSYVHYAAIYAQLGRDREAKEAARKVLELDPDYPKHAKSDIEYWNWGVPGHVEHWVDGLRKAGLEILPQE